MSYINGYVNKHYRDKYAKKGRETNMNNYYAGTIYKGNSGGSVGTTTAGYTTWIDDGTSSAGSGATPYKIVEYPYVVDIGEYNYKWDYKTYTLFPEKEEKAIAPIKEEKKPSRRKFYFD